MKIEKNVKLSIVSYFKPGLHTRIYIESVGD